MRVDILNRKDDILQWIADNEPKAFICRQLRCKPETLESYLKKMNIEYKGNIGLKGKKTDIGYIPVMDYIKSELSIKAHKVRLKLIKEGIKEHKCEMCNNTEWNNEPIPLELDHIDGDRYNNNFDNLRIICPNCHAQTPTNSGKNRGRYN